MRIGKRLASLAVLLILAAPAVLWIASHRRTHAADGGDKTTPLAINGNSVELSPSQLRAVKIESVGSRRFPVDRETVGTISFADDLSVPVYPPYPGTIMQAFVELNAAVVCEQPLYTIRSPDLLDAESTLISAAATFELTTKELHRVQGLAGVSQREKEQAASDQQTADGALKAARDSVRVFGKTDDEIDRMIAQRRTDPALVVRSPIAGRITAFNAPPGLLVQPGNPPPPYTVSDVTVKWMLANVLESDIPLMRPGDPVQVNVMAFPGRVFRATISKIYSSVDPNTHRATVRCEVHDGGDQLRPGMLANFVIRVKDPAPDLCVPAAGIVREPDGSMTAWVTSDRRRFQQRIVQTGLRRDDRVEILGGLQAGELVVSDGAIFLSNMLASPGEE